MKCEYTADDIVKDLEALRRSGSRCINEIFALTEILGCEEAEAEAKILRVTALIRAVFSDGREADTLLLSLNLLSRYRNIKELGERRLAFYADELSREGLKNPVSALHKRENRLMRRLAEHVAGILGRSGVGGIQKLLEPCGEPHFELQPLMAAKIVTESRPLQPSGFFVGRERKLAEIKKELTGNAKLLLLNGMGGIGKTEMCRKLFHEAINEGLKEVDRVGWITLIGSVEQSFFRKFEEIDRPSDNAEKYLDQAGRYINSLGGRLLLFVDNANDISGRDAEWLLRLGCKIVLTSRNERIERMLPIEIERLEIEDCRVLYRLHSKTGIPDTESYYGFPRVPDGSPDDDLDGILELAQRHTLAVELLAKTQRASGKTTAQMLGLLRQSGFSLNGISEAVSYRHNPELPVQDKNEEIFIRQFSKVFDIAGIIGEKRRVIRLFSLLAPESVEFGAAKDWLCLPDLDAINSLVNSGWLVSGEFFMDTAGTERRFGFSMHPLISSVVRHQDMPDYELSRPLVKAVTETITLEKEEDFLTKVPYINHASSVIDNVSAEDDCYISLINAASVILFNMPSLSRAAEILTKAIRLSDELPVQSALTKAASRHNLAYVRFLQKEYDDSLCHGLEALAIRERILGRMAVSTAQTINNLGRAYDGKCDFESAMRCFEEAAAILSHALGPDDPMTVHLSNNIGVTYFHMGRYEEAHDFFSGVLARLIRSLGERHADTARAYHNVSSAAYCLGRNAEALDMALKSHALYEAALGREHNYVAEITHNIACMYRETGAPEKALQWHVRAIAIREKVFGGDAPDTAESYNGIASVLSELGRYDEALPYFEKALAINEGKLGGAHDGTGETYNGLADLYRETGRFNEAFICADRAIDIYRRALGESHPYLAEALNSKGGIYLKTGDLAEAMEYYEKALKIRRAALGDNHAATAESMFNIGRVHAALGEHDAALRRYLSALRVLERQFGLAEHPKVRETLDGIRSEYLANGGDEACYDAWLEEQRRS